MQCYLLCSLTRVVTNVMSLLFMTLCTHRYECRLSRYYLTVLIIWYVDSLTKHYGEAIKISSTIGSVLGVTRTIESDGTVKRIHIFYGIPYAEPPRNFAKPIAKAPFKDGFVFNATKPGAICPQFRSEHMPQDKFDISDDCLTLNIYSPSENDNFTESKSVMIFIHGGFDHGTFQTGASNFFVGDVLSAFGDVVVVTFNYRLGLQGFLTTYDDEVKGNFGLWDQHMAIRWVQDNIREFGGDPDRVTLFGQSTGAVCALYQAMYPGNIGLFHRVIAESGTPVSIGRPNMGPYFKEIPTDTLASVLGCPRGNIDCLRAKSTPDMIANLSSLSADDPAKNWYYTPVIDGEFIKADPRTMLDKNNTSYTAVQEFFSSLDLIIGVNNMDGFSRVSSALKDHVYLNDTLFHRLELRDTTRGALEELWGPLQYMDQDRGNQLVDYVIDRYTDLIDPKDSLRTLLLFQKLVTDYCYSVPILKTALLHARLNNSKRRNTFLYELGVRPSLNEGFFKRPPWVSGATPLDDTLYVFGFSRSMLDAFNVGAGYTPSQQDTVLSKLVMTLWTSFAKVGDPAGTEGTFYWPAYIHESSGFLKLDHQGNKVDYDFASPSATYWTEQLPLLVETLNATQPQHCIAHACIDSKAADDTNVGCWLPIVILLMVNIIVVVVVVVWYKRKCLSPRKSIYRTEAHTEEVMLPVDVEVNFEVKERSEDVDNANGAKSDTEEYEETISDLDEGTSESYQSPKRSEDTGRDMEQTQLKPTPTVAEKGNPVDEEFTEASESLPSSVSPQHQRQHDLTTKTAGGTGPRSLPILPPSSERDSKGTSYRARGPRPSAKSDEQTSVTETSKSPSERKFGETSDTRRQLSTPLSYQPSYERKYGQTSDLGSHPSTTGSNQPSYERKYGKTSDLGSPPSTSVSNQPSYERKYGKTSDLGRHPSTTGSNQPSFEWKYGKTSDLGSHPSTTGSNQPSYERKYGQTSGLGGHPSTTGSNQPSFEWKYGKTSGLGSHPSTTGSNQPSYERKYDKTSGLGGHPSTTGSNQPSFERKYGKTSGLGSHPSSYDRKYGQASDTGNRFPSTKPYERPRYRDPGPTASYSSDLQQYYP